MHVTRQRLTLTASVIQPLGTTTAHVGKRGPTKRTEEKGITEPNQKHKFVACGMTRERRACARAPTSDDRTRRKQEGDQRI
eukprot:5452499-Pyramimonas_sp.AAC.1